VLPEVPVRQWVLTLPFALRCRLAYDTELTAAVLREFLRAVFAALRRRSILAKDAGPARAGQEPRQGLADGGSSML
jgi:hypothetical protein